MSPTYFMMGWIVLMLLILCQQVWTAVKVTQPYSAAATDGTAQVRCYIRFQPANQHSPATSGQMASHTYPDIEEFRVSLLKGLHGNQEVCSSILNITQQSGLERQKQGQCFAEVKDSVVEVTVFGLKPADTDLYRCRIEIYYPPPFLSSTGNGTLIHVSDSQSCPVHESQRQFTLQGDDEQDDEENKTMVPVVVLLILVVFLLIIIISFQTLLCNQEREVMNLLHV